MSLHSSHEEIRSIWYYKPNIYDDSTSFGILTVWQQPLKREIQKYRLRRSGAWKRTGYSSTSLPHNINNNNKFLLISPAHFLAFYIAFAWVHKCGCELNFQCNANQSEMSVILMTSMDIKIHNKCVHVLEKYSKLKFAYNKSQCSCAINRSAGLFNDEQIFKLTKSARHHHHILFYMHLCMSGSIAALDGTIYFNLLPKLGIVFGCNKFIMCSVHSAHYHA